jgi:hypothetical protein
MQVSKNTAADFYRRRLSDPMRSRLLPIYRPRFERDLHTRGPQNFDTFCKTTFATLSAMNRHAQRFEIAFEWGRPFWNGKAKSSVFIFLNGHPRRYSN